MPEEDPLVVALAAGLVAGDDLSELRVQRLLGEEAAVDVLAQRTEPAARLALAPVVDDDLVHHIEQVELDGADRPVWNDERTLADPGRAQERLGLDEPRRLDDDVRAFHCLLRRPDRTDRLVQLTLECTRELVSRLGAPARDADLLEVEQLIEEHDVPEGGAARADVAEHVRVVTSEVLRADCGERTGAPRGEIRRVDGRRRRTRLRVEEQDQAELGRQVAPVVLDEVTDDLHACRVQWLDECTQDVPVSVEPRARLEVHTRLEDDPALTLCADDVLHGCEELRIPGHHGGDVAGGQVTKLERHRLEPNRSDTYGLAVGLLERLKDGPVVCAEGYLFECERRGYLQAGAFVPEVVLEHPEVVAELHREFVHAGSDVVEAFTYYGHREKLRLIGREGDLEPLNRGALAIAKEVADETGALLAGNISNTNLFEPDDESRRTVRAMFDEQIEWAVDAGVDFIIGETFSHYEETSIALDAIKASGLPAVVTIAVHQHPETRDGLSLPEACRRLEEEGAAVVGLNCIRGPRTMMPVLRNVREACSGYVAALPVPYRTTDEQPTFQSLRDPNYPPPNGRPFPDALDPFVCTRYELGDFAREAFEIGVTYLGVCCGAGPHHIRAVAEAVGKTPPASRYTADMSKHAYFGTDPTLKTENQEFAEQL